LGDNQGRSSQGCSISHTDNAEDCGDDDADEAGVWREESGEERESRKMRLRSKVASEFLGEWQEPCGLKNGRVRAYTEIGDDLAYR
jgi:hypothetical protein